MNETKRRPGLSLIEVVVSTVILGVVSIAYAATYRGQVMQRDAYEDLAIAMEMTARQIEYLRAMDVRKAKNPADFYAPPFNSVFNRNGAGASLTLGPCMLGANSLPYGSTELDFDMVAGAPKGVEGGGSALALPFLTGTPRTEPPGGNAVLQDGNSVVLPERFTVGPPGGTLAAPTKPVELWMPTMFLLQARNYSAVVRATRVRAGLEGGNPVQPYHALLHYQITIYKGEAGRAADRRPVLVTNFLREADVL